MRLVMFFSRVLAAIFNYRHRLIEGVGHDIRQRYVGSIFGVTWMFLYPLLQLSIYAALYSLVFKVKLPGLNEMDYVVLIFSGLIPLIAFSEMITATTNSLSSNKNLLLNTVFPAELIPLRAALVAMMPGIISFFATMLLALVVDRATWYSLVVVPFIWMLLFMFVMGLGWVLSLMSLVSKDIQYGLGLIIMLLFVLSPFAYTPDMVPEQLRFIIYLNPMSYFVFAFQQLICYGSLPSFGVLVAVITLSFVSFFGGFYVFQRVKNVFFDYA